MGRGRCENQAALKITRRGETSCFEVVGTVARGRVRESTGLESERHAEAERVKLEARILDEATYGKRHTATFAEAVGLYRIKDGSHRFVRRFGTKRTANILNATPATLQSEALRHLWRQAGGLCLRAAGFLNLCGGLRTRDMASMGTGQPIVP